MRPSGADRRRLRVAVRHVLRVRVGMGMVLACVAAVALPGTRDRRRRLPLPGPRSRGPARTSSTRRRPPRPQLENAGDLAREADPGLGRERLPRRRVPLPGLPLRRPRRHGGPSRPRRPPHVGRHLLAAERHLHLSRPTPPTPTTPPTSSSCASSRWPTPPRSGSRSTRMKDPSLVATTIAIGGSPQPRAVPLRRQRDRARRSSSSPCTATTPTCGAPPPASSSTRRHRSRSRTRAPPDRGARPAQAWDPGERTVRLAAGVGLWDKAADRYLDPGRRGRRDPPGRRRGALQPDRLLQRRLPLRRALAARRSRPTPCSTNPAWWRDRAAGHRARQGRPQPVPRRRRLRQARRRGHRRHARQAPGVPRTARWTASSPATSRPSRAPTTRPPAAAPTDCQGELRGRLQPYAIYVPKKPAAAARLRPDPAPALARRQLQPVRRQPQPVPARRARPGLDRDHARGPRPRRLVLRTRRRRHLRGLGRRRHGTTGSIPAGRRSPATRWAATAPTSSRPSSRTCSPGRTRSSAHPGSGVWVPPAPPQPGGDASNTNRMLASVRNIPFLIWDGTEDELVPGAGRRRPRRRPSTSSATATATTCSRRADHFALARQRPVRAGGAASSAPTEVDRNPAHVTYVVNPTMDFAAAGHGRRPCLLAVGPEAPRLQRERSAGQGRRALGGLRTRRPGAEPDPDRARVAPGGQPGRRCRTSSDRRAGAPRRRRPRANVLHLDAQNLAQVVVHPARARLSCHSTARRHHRRPADRDAGRLRSHAPLRRPVGGHGSPRSGLGQLRR